MIDVRFDPDFLKQVRSLPIEQKRKLSKLIPLLKNNVYDSRLHTKKLEQPLAGQYSFRISRDWRVIFRFLSEKAVFLTRVKHRKDVYR